MERIGGERAGQTADIRKVAAASFVGTTIEWYDFSELFGTRVRYSGASLGYQLASVLAGGLSPFIAAALLTWAGGEPWPVALYMAVMALISVIAVLLARETYRGDIMEEQPEERRLIAEGPEPGV